VHGRLGSMFETALRDVKAIVDGAAGSPGIA
jgi:hypothetical protein